MGWLNPLAAACGVIMLCARFRRRFEEALPPVLCLIPLVLLPLGMLGCLHAVDWIAGGVVLLAVWRAIAARRRGWLTLRKALDFARQYLLTPGLLCFLLLAAFFAYATSTRHIIHNDEYNYWATMVRSLWVSDGFVNGAHSCVPSFSSYMPGMQLVQWWAMRSIGRWSEPMLYCTQFLFNACMLLPLARYCRRWYLAPLFCGLAVALPTVFSGNAYFMLGVDGTMGFLFGYALFGIDNRRDRFDALGVCAALTALVLAKQSGVIWAVFAIAYVPIAGVRRGARGEWLLIVLPAAVCMLGWQLFCNANGLGVHFAKEGFMAVLGKMALPERFGTLINELTRVIMTVPASQSGLWDGIKAGFGLPLPCWLALFMAAAFMRRKANQSGIPCAPDRQKTALRACLYFLIITAVYFILHALSGITLFSSDIELTSLIDSLKNNSGHDRYWMPYYYGIAYLCCGWLAGCAVEVRQSAPRGRLKAAALVAGLVAATLVFTNWDMLKCLYPPLYIDRFPRYCNAEERRAQPWVSAIENPESARVLTSAHYYTYFDMYSLPPISIISFDFESAKEQSREAFRALLRERGATHVYVYHDNDYLYSEMCERFGMTLEPGRLYRLDFSDADFVLIPLTDAKGVSLI